MDEDGFGGSRLAYLKGTTVFPSYRSDCGKLSYLTGEPYFGPRQSVEEDMCIFYVNIQMKRNIGRVGPLVSHTPDAEHLITYAIQSEFRTGPIREAVDRFRIFCFFLPQSRKVGCMCGILFCARWDNRKEDEGDDSLDGLLEDLKVANARRGSYFTFLRLWPADTAHLYSHHVKKLTYVLVHRYRSRCAEYPFRPLVNWCGAGCEERAEARILRF